MFKPCATSLVLFITLLNFVCGLDFETVKEKKCFKPNNTVPIDMQWLASQKAIYYPYMSKLDLFIMAAELSGREYEDLTEEEISNESCMIITISPEGQMLGTGFKNQTVEMAINPLTGLEIYEFSFEDGIQGTCYSTMTDNKSFLVTLCCSNGDQMSWSVVSPVTTLPKETLQEIYEYIESIGFAKEHFTKIRYDKCDLGSVKEEL